MAFSRSQEQQEQGEAVMGAVGLQFGVLGLGDDGLEFNGINGLA